MSLDVDSNGWPTVAAVDAKLQTVYPGTWSLAVYADMAASLSATIAEFQGPVPTGTGRNFTPVIETRYFDGNGYPELIVPDIVPNTTLTVAAFGVNLTDVLLKTNNEGLGWNILTRRRDTASFYYADLQYAVFLVGHQNIAVTATWGYAAQVPGEIADAVAGEAARRILVQNVGGVTGVGSTIKTEATMTQPGSGTLSLRTSALAAWEDRYNALKCSYRVSQARKTRALVRRMS